MLSKEIKNIRIVLRGFTGKEGEPFNEKEFYILKSMWIMLCAELEGSIKSLIENYIELIKKKKVTDIHPCLLLQNTYGGKKQENNLSKKMIFDLFKIKKVKIEKNNFINKKKTLYKSEAIEKVFNSLGLFFTKNQQISLKILDSIASTRDAISHGDKQISITRKQLELNLSEVTKIYNMLKRKLK